MCAIITFFEFSIPFPRSPTQTYTHTPRNAHILAQEVHESAMEEMGRSLAIRKFRAPVSTPVGNSGS